MSLTEVGPIDPANLPAGVTLVAGPPSSDGEVTGRTAAYSWSGGAGWRIPTDNTNAAFRADFDSSMNVESVSISPGYSGIENTAELQAFDSQGNLIGSDSADLVGWENLVTLTVSDVGEISHILAGAISPITSSNSWVSLGTLIVGVAMATPYIEPEDVSPEDAQKVMGFLNAAQTAQEIADAVEIPDERDVGIRVAQRILDRRDELGGFANLDQVARVPQVGPERFTEIVNSLLGTQMGGDAMATSYGSFEIKNYLYHFISSKARGGNDVSIILRGAPPLQVDVKFRADDAESFLPALEYAAGERYGLCYPRSTFPELVDMLRNEAPVYFHWFEGGATLSTQREPIGEGDLDTV